MPARDGWAKKLGWLVLLWTLGVAALGVAALLVRALMRVAGLGA